MYSSDPIKNHPPSTFTMDSENIRLTIKIRDIEKNVDLKDDLFVLTPPEGLPVETLE